MTPIEFPECNAQVPDHVTHNGTYPVMKTDDGGAISCWELTFEEIQQVKQTGKIYLIHDIKKGFTPVMPVTDIHSYILDDEQPLNAE